MAIYKIFPEKDSTIYSQYPLKNTGLDEIVEVSKELNTETQNVIAESVRTLLKFSNSDVSSAYSLIGTSSYDIFLRMYLASASAIPLDYTVYCHPISGSWGMGTGRFSNYPQTTDGVSWIYRSEGVAWSTSGSYVINSTGSYNLTSGGGTWNTVYSASQSFNYATNKDINFSVKNIVLQHYSNSLGLGGIPNEGIIVKHNNEFTTSSIFSLKYFSRDTHTIYPPHLEIKWDDSIYATGSLTVVSSSNIVISIPNNASRFREDDVVKIKLNVRDKFPTRQFITSSVYLNKKLLPSTSYWSIKDLHTEEVVVDFDDNYTKISANSDGNYFTIYMNGLEPERNYKFLFKTVIGGETLVVDDNFYFKVVR